MGGSFRLVWFQLAGDGRDLYQFCDLLAMLSHRCRWLVDAIGRYFATDDSLFDVRSSERRRGHLMKTGRKLDRPMSERRRSAQDGFILASCAATTVRARTGVSSPLLTRVTASSMTCDCSLVSSPR